MQGHCALSLGRNGLWRAASKNQTETGWEPVGENQRPDQNWTPCGGGLLRAAWPYGACWRDLLLWIQESLHSQDFIPMGDFNRLDICWENNTAGCKRSRRLLENNFLAQVLEKPTRGEVILDLVLASADELIKGTETQGSLGCSDWALVEFGISKSGSLEKSKVRTLNLDEWNSSYLMNWWMTSPGKLSSRT